MRTLRVPLQIDSGGGLAEATATRDIVEQQILDIVMTNYGERAFRPRYGADLRSFLFSPIRDEVMQIRANEVADLLRSYVVLADIIDVSLAPVSGVGNESTVRLTVRYSIKPSGQVLVLQQTVSGLITEETF